MRVGNVGFVPLGKHTMVLVVVLLRVLFLALFG